ncbi:MAG: hypothetical protein IT437_08745 [Phycisphaerales bacterium]|nr:hypothetical protein [Phycisphaerales bacterium]
MTATDPARKLSALLKRLRAAGTEPVCEPARCEAGEEPAVHELLLSFLAWEAGLHRAGPAVRKLVSGIVDMNELRVCHPDELASSLGERYPRGLERCARLRSALNDLYRREHAVTLAPLEPMPKRDARAYLESLEGMTPYVAARILLVSLGGHAMPLDERTHSALLAARAVPADLSLVDAGSWLERHVRAGDALAAHVLLEGWVTEAAARPPDKKRPGADAAGRVTPRGARGKRGVRPPSSA